MQLNEKYFQHILLDLLDESPLACRGIFGLCRIEYSDQVETLCVTLGRPSVLCVNLGFLEKHCANETHVKAALVHEFLHILLRHTERIVRMTPLLNIALDAVINGIIDRTLGTAYSEFMTLYYRETTGIARLLRPVQPSDFDALDKISRIGDHEDSLREASFLRLWEAIYCGKLVADDVYEIVRKLQNQQLATLLPEGRYFLGNHDSDAPLLDFDELDADGAHHLRQILDELAGKGVWRNPKTAREHFVSPSTRNLRDLEQWRRKTIKILRECITPDRRASLREPLPREFWLPVLNSNDRRGFLRSLYGELLLPIAWQSQISKPRGTVQIYLDISGSMSEEIQDLLQLLVSFQSHIRQPFWAFSDCVQTARIINGRLQTKGTGGTSINPVLEHIAITRPGRSIIITDGIVEECDPTLVARISGQKIQAIISAQGVATKLDKHGFRCTKLSKLDRD